jgi:hypothetical protein
VVVVVCEFENLRSGCCCAKRRCCCCFEGSRLTYGIRTRVVHVRGSNFWANAPFTTALSTNHHHSNRLSATSHTDTHTMFALGITLYRLPLVAGVKYVRLHLNGRCHLSFVQNRTSHGSTSSHRQQAKRISVRASECAGITSSDLKTI